MSTGAADVPAFLWHCNLQCPTLLRLKEGVWQEPGKGHRANQNNNPPTPNADIEAEYWSAAAHLLPLQWGGSQSSPTWTFSLAVLGDGLAQGLVHDLNLWGNVRRCTNSCHTLICDGREHNETTAQRTEQRNEGSSLYTIWFLCACVSNWIGTAALDKGPNLLLLGETIISFYWFMVER